MFVLLVSTSERFAAGMDWGNFDDFCGKSGVAGTWLLSVELLEVAINCITDVTKTVFDIVKTDQAGFEGNNRSILIRSNVNTFNMVIFISNNIRPWAKFVHIHGSFKQHLFTPLDPHGRNQVCLLIHYLKNSQIAFAIADDEVIGPWEQT